MNITYTLTWILASLLFMSAADVAQVGAQTDTTSPWLVQPPTDYEKAVEAVNEQLTALRLNDSSKAYYAYTTKGFRKAFSLDDFKNLVRRYKVFNQNRSFRADNAEFDGATVVKLHGKLLSVDGENMNVKYDMVLEDGEWKVQNIQMSMVVPKNRFQTGPGPGR